MCIELKEKFNLNCKIKPFIINTMIKKLELKRNNFSWWHSLNNLARDWN